MKYKMNKKVKAKWLKALRSGNYRQATGQLIDRDYGSKNHYCCLGVLCALHAKETGNKFDGEEYLGDNTQLPREVTKWAGISHAGNLNKKVEGQSCLVGLNDSAQFSFKQIADVIEEQF